jgi:hypothetical protein
MRDAKLRAARRATKTRRETTSSLCDGDESSKDP